MVADSPSLLWTLCKDGHDMACQARLVSYGVEIDIARDGATVATRTFENGEEALAWADRRRAEREAQGWTAC